MAEEAFLRAILDNPKDDAPLLVYADWLEEQGDPVSVAKAEFLRLTVEHSLRSGKKTALKAREQRLQQLAATLDTSWLTTISRLPIESCQGKRAEAQAKQSFPLAFELLCDRRWEDLTTTSDRRVRFCDGCQHIVHYCDTITQAREHAWAGHCIAVDLGVMRRKDDLEPQRHWVGMPSLEILKEEEERMKPDPVSAERERPKRGLVGGE